MTEFVLDASVVIAGLQRERGGVQARQAFPGSLLSAVNATEVVQRLVHLGHTEAAVRLSLNALPCQIVAFDLPQAIVAGELRRQTQSQGLSLGDRACLALAKLRGLPAITADRAWAAVDAGVEIVLIR